MALSPGQSGWAGTRSTSHSGFLWVPRRYCSPTHAVSILSSSPLTGTPADNITGMAHWRWPDNNDLTSHDYLPDAVPVTTLPNNSSLDWHHSILVIRIKFGKHNILGCHAIELLFSLVQSILQPQNSFWRWPATISNTANITKMNKYISQGRQTSVNNFIIIYNHIQSLLLFTSDNGGGKYDCPRCLSVC